MSCPTCDHTLEGIGYGMFHCPRCGTLKGCPNADAVFVPALVERCRNFMTHMTDEEGPLTAGQRLTFRQEWHRLGVNESTNTPENR